MNRKRGIVHTLGKKDASKMSDPKEEQRTFLPNSKDALRCSSLLSKRDELLLMELAEIIFKAFLNSRKS